MTIIGHLRRRTFFILEVDRFGSRASRLVDVALIALIVLNVVVAIVQSDARIYAKAPWAFEAFEALSLVIFSLEYLLRVWSCVEDEEYSRPVWDRVRFALQPMMLLDLFVLGIPYIAGDIRAVRILRLLRLGRYSPRLRLFGRVLRDKRDELFVGLFVAVVLLVACSTAMFHVEGPTKEGFRSIPETMWWGVATLTTVGYGDVYPDSGLGRMLGSLVALLGVGVFALPAGILASGFSDALDEEKKRAQELRTGPNTGPQPALAAHGAASEGTCPTCGTSLSETDVPAAAPPRAAPDSGQRPPAP